MLLDGRMKASAAFLGLAGVCALFGVIHSPLASEQIGLPYDMLVLVQQQNPGRTEFWNAVRYQTPYHWAAAYGLCAVLLLGLSLFKASALNPEAPREDKSVLLDEETILMSEEGERPA
jgi:hypothetical protein